MVPIDPASFSQLSKRDERRDAATKELARAEEAGDAAAIEKFARRTVRVTKQHNEDTKTLLALMGIPFVEVISWCWLPVGPVTFA